MIVGIQRLRFDCRECYERADFVVTRTNDELPKGFVQWGQRNIYYCTSHLPEDAKQEFRAAEGPEALVERYDFEDRP